LLQPKQHGAFALFLALPAASKKIDIMGNGNTDIAIHCRSHILNSDDHSKEYYVEALEKLKNEEEKRKQNEKLKMYKLPSP
jgi:hypothetical protein